MTPRYGYLRPSCKFQKLALAAIPDFLIGES